MTNWQVFLSSILLGWGAAIPFGPINLEIMRRNLAFGTSFGLTFGIGVCAADITYVGLLCLGVLSLIQQPLTLHIITVLGSCVLAWFGYKALLAKSSIDGQLAGSPKSPLRSGIEGYLLTLINPFTVLFWASVSTQLTSIAKGNGHSLFFACTGVMIGTFSWMSAFNGMLHLTRHKVTPAFVRVLNSVGGLILLGFAFYGLYKVFRTGF